MGLFLNPDNSGFQAALNAKIYVDKTGLLNYTNSVLRNIPIQFQKISHHCRKPFL